MSEGPVPSEITEDGCHPRHQDMRTPSNGVKLRKTNDVYIYMIYVNVLTHKTLVACLNGRMDRSRMVVTWAKDGMLPPIVCDHDAFRPLYGMN